MSSGTPRVLSSNDDENRRPHYTSRSSARSLDASTPSNPTTSFLATALSKFIVVPGLFLTKTISILLLIGTSMNWTISGQFYVLVIRNRASAQIVAQLLSGLLGAVHTYTLCTIINLSTRIELIQHGLSLDHLTFWATLSTATLNWSSLKRYVVVVLVFYGITVAPAAVWTGAPRPITGSAFKANTTLSIAIPLYSEASTKYWLMQKWSNASAPMQNAFGTFSYSPTRDIAGLILTNSRSASTRDVSPQVHSKNDNSGFQYHGRSYGVGTSFGLVSDSMSIETFRY